MGKEKYRDKPKSQVNESVAFYLKCDGFHTRPPAADALRWTLNLENKELFYSSLFSFPCVQNAGQEVSFSCLPLDILQALDKIKTHAAFR